jgi:hypothetical protein
MPMDVDVMNAGCGALVLETVKPIDELHVCRNEARAVGKLSSFIQDLALLGRAARDFASAACRSCRLPPSRCRGPWIGIKRLVVLNGIRHYGHCTVKSEPAQTGVDQEETFTGTTIVRHSALC